jgi:hypothetical protein
MVNQARFDYGCPRCGCSFEQFTYRKRRMGKMEAEMSYLLEEKTRRLENADALREIEEIAADGNLKAFRQICDIANAALRTAEESSVVDRTPAKQPEGTTKLDKALQNIDVVKRVLVENSCPSEFGLKDCEFNPESGCTLCCEECWNGEVTE